MNDFVQIRAVHSRAGSTTAFAGSRVTSPTKRGSRFTLYKCCMHSLIHATCHNIPLGGSGSSVTPAVPRPLGSTLSQSDSGVIPIPTTFHVAVM